MHFHRPRLLVDHDPDDIHDLRVTSRRLQQVVSLMFPKPRRAKSRKVIRSLRDLRRDWGSCRNLDVDLTLLQEKLESLETDGVRDAWNYVRECLVELRAQELDRAQKRLRRLDILAFIERTQRLFKSVTLENVQDLNLEESFADTLAEWREAVAQAKSRRIRSNCTNCGSQANDCATVWKSSRNWGTPPQKIRRPH